MRRLFGSTVTQFYIVLADLFRSLQVVRVERDAELLIDRYLLVCNLHPDGPPGFTQKCKTRRSYRLQWKTLAEKDVRKTFAESVSSFFRELPECTVEVESNLFKAVVASSAARVCGQKRLGVANNAKPIGGTKIRKMLFEQRKQPTRHSCKTSRIFFAFAVYWGAKVCSAHGEKKP